MSGRFLCGKILWVVLLWGLSATGTVQAGVYLRGDTKLLCTPDDGRVKPAFGVVEYMAWRDALAIVNTLEGWSKRYELVWELDLADP